MLIQTHPAIGAIVQSVRYIGIDHKIEVLSAYRTAMLIKIMCDIFIIKSGIDLIYMVMSPFLSENRA